MGFALKHDVRRVAALCYLVNTFEWHMLVFDTDLSVACLEENRFFRSSPLLVGDNISDTLSQRIKTYSSTCRLSVVET